LNANINLSVTGACVPSFQPSFSPSQLSKKPFKPTNNPTKNTGIPSDGPSGNSSHKPSYHPSNKPSNLPTFLLSAIPSDRPSGNPSHKPSKSFSPSDEVIAMPSSRPTTFDISDSNIFTARDLFFSNYKLCLATYGHVRFWEVGTVTTFYDDATGKGLFEDYAYFAGNIVDWDLSSATSVASMFRFSNKFGKDISSWDVSKVLNFSLIFDDAAIFNSPISTWDLSSATTVEAMFRDAIRFNQDLSSWNVGNVISFESTFRNAIRFNQDITPWTINASADMTSMFEESEGLDQIICWHLPTQTTTNIILNANINLSVTGACIPSFQPSFSPSQLSLCTNNGKDMFVLLVKGSPKLKKCTWLDTKSSNTITNICQKKVHYSVIGKITYSPAQIVCKLTCNSCDSCYENPNSKYFKRLKKNKAIISTCKKLKGASIDKDCKKRKSSGGYPPAKLACPVTCSGITGTC